MSLFGKLEKVLRPVLFYGNNWTSLIGGAITSASAIVLVGFWVVEIFGHAGSRNPYLGIIFDLFLPGLFVLGLLLIPIGIGLRRRQLKALGQIPSAYPRIELRDPGARQLDRKPRQGGQGLRRDRHGHDPLPPVEHRVAR